MGTQTWRHHFPYRRFRALPPHTDAGCVLGVALRMVQGGIVSPLR